jgi:hypothetical protein
MPLRNDVEVVLIDDGSHPPIEIDKYNFALTFQRTNDFRPWTQAAARMKGINLSLGDRLICIDIDHIVTDKLISFVANSKYDFIKFRRKLAVLDENGNLKADHKNVMEYGVPIERIKKRGLNVCPPGNCYAISKELFRNAVSICPENERPLIYAIPNGRFCGGDDMNPFGLFHNLSRIMDEYRNDFWIAEDK